MFKTYKEAEIFLKERSKLGIKPGLERMEGLLSAAGHPERTLQAVHIAGTNGKGSTAHFLMNALMQNGKRVGFFTSPSFSGLTGHIFINNMPIAEDDFLNELNRLMPAIEELDQQKLAPTEFEIITAIAFQHLSRNADFAVIETGMGGRFDTTNVFMPILSIITSIAKDHAAFLGETLEEIAWHKAGILKAERPGVIGKMQPAPLSVIMKEAARLHAPLNLMGEDFWIENRNATASGQQFNWHSQRFGSHLALIKMHGSHQADNAALALMALHLLEETGMSLDWDQVLSGMEMTVVSGRFEQIMEEPAVFLDGAHNPDGIDMFAKTAKSYAKDQRKRVLFTAFRDKEIDVMLNRLKADFDDITLVTFEHPRALNELELDELAACHHLKTEPDWKAAIRQALDSAHADDCIFVTGSLNFILQVRAYLKNES